MGQLAIQLPPAILARLTVITLARAAACRLRHRQRGHAISRIRFTSKGKPPQGPSSVRNLVDGVAEAGRVRAGTGIRCRFRS